VGFCFGDPRRNIVKVATHQPMTHTLDRITTEYLDTEDRIRLSGQCADGCGGAGSDCVSGGDLADPAPMLYGP